METTDKVQILLAYLGVALLTLLFCAGIVHGSNYVYKSGQDIDLKVPCFNNGTYCSISTACNITIQYPNGSALIHNQVMDNQVSYYNYTIPRNYTGINGNYFSSMSCCGSSCGYSTFTFDITPNGFNQTTAQGINSLAYLIILVALTFFLGWLGFKLIDTEYWWAFGILLLVLSLFLVVYDVWVGYEYQAILTGLGEANTMQVFFVILLVVIGAGMTVAVIVMLKNWSKLKGKIKEAITEDQGEDDDGWDNNNFLGNNMDKG